MAVIDRVKDRVLSTMKDYRMIVPGDRIVCAASGGKDSTVLLDILSSIHDVSAVTIDTTVPDYSSRNLENLMSFCRNKGIRLDVISLKDKTGHSLESIKRLLKSRGMDYNYCHICGVLKRYFLNQYALEMGATKIATGHNIDDISQSILMNMLRGNVLMSLGLVPVSGTVKDMSFVRRIKPLFFIPEGDLESYSRKAGFPVVYARCPYAKTAYRNHLRDLLQQYQEVNSCYRENLVMSHLKALDKHPQAAPLDASEPGAERILRVCKAQVSD